MEFILKIENKSIIFVTKVRQQPLNSLFTTFECCVLRQRNSEKFSHSQEIKPFDDPAQHLETTPSGNWTRAI
jgi:hypothetical protein